MTVAEIGKTQCNCLTDIVAQCIGLHLHLERKRARVPKAIDVISCDLLDPKRAGRVLAVDAAIRAALAVGGQTLH